MLISDSMIHFQMVFESSRCWNRSEGTAFCSQQVFFLAVQSLKLQGALDSYKEKENWLGKVRKRS